MPTDLIGECSTPAGFRTNFQPGLIDDNARVGSRHRSITAEYKQLQLKSTNSNITFDFLRQARTYRLNRGTSMSAVPGGFNVDVYNHHLPGLRHTRLIRQSIATNLVPQNGYQPTPNGISRRNFWLAAPKTTDSLFISVRKARKGLRIERVSGANHVTSVRAAALSATFILVHRAALDLDIDPEEFDIVDPRIQISTDGMIPVLQITDHLVNGSGFCERLATLDSGDPMVVSLIKSIVKDPQAFPLKEYRSVKEGLNHAEQCDQSCYLCLQRYGNQTYHGLLDWRLGLSFLEAMENDQFICGLDGTFQASHSLSDWPQLAERYASDLIANYRTGGEVVKIGQLTAFRFERTRTQWVIVVHPLWNVENPTGILAEAIRELGGRPEFTDTFELSRRQVTERERLRRSFSRV